MSAFHEEESSAQGQNIKYSHLITIRIQGKAPSLVLFLLKVT